jgi:hypothetical protein
VLGNLNFFGNLVCGDLWQNWISCCCLNIWENEGIKFLKSLLTIRFLGLDSDVIENNKGIVSKIELDD